MAGYTVSSAGDFNPGVDSLGDFMIGSPGGNGGAGRVNLFYGVSTGTINSTGQYTAGLIANATNPIALNNPTAPLALTGVGRSVPPSSAPVPAFEPGSRLSYFNATSSTTASIILIGAPSNITGPGGSGSVYEIQGPTTGTFQTQLQPLNSTIARQYTLTFPTTCLEQQPDWIRYLCLGLRKRKRRFHRGRSGLHGNPADNDQRHHEPTLLVGAAAVVLTLFNQRTP